MDALALGDSIGQSQQGGDLLNEAGPGALVTAPGRRPLADLGALGRGHRVEFMFALLAAREHPYGVPLAASATAGGFATFAAQEIEGAWGKRALGGHGAQETAQDGMEAPEPLPEAGDIVGHLYLYNHI
jgi:hypothetical protein